MSSIRRFLLTGTVSLAVVLALFVQGHSAEPAKRISKTGTARLDTYVKPTGEGYFALALRSQINLQDSRSRDIVVLLDTSASQTGIYRKKSWAALETFLSGLDQGDRVHLFSVDMNAIAMTDSFVHPQSADMSKALAKLKRRVPLGSTDMEAALTKAAGLFVGSPTRARAVVYLGDGNSTANFLDSKAFGQLVRALVERRISVSSYAVGPKANALAPHPAASPPAARLSVGEKPREVTGVSRCVSAEM